MPKHTDSVLPQCAANLARLEITTETLAKDVGKLMVLHQDLDRNITALTHTIVERVDTAVQQHTNECPLLVGLRRKEIATLEELFNIPNNNERNKPTVIVQEGRFMKFARDNFSKALFTLLVALVLAVVTALMTSCVEHSNGDLEMHRTEGTGYVLEGGKRRFIDQDLTALPPVPGTVDPAEFSNAVQEEVCKIIEQYGGNCDITAAADRAAGWTALHDTIFSGGNITTAAIDEMSASKLSAGTIDITVGDNNWLQDATQVALTLDDDPSAGDFAGCGVTPTSITLRTKYGGADGFDTANIGAYKLWFTETEDADGAEYIARTEYSARGILYTQKYGNSTDLAEAKYRKEAYSVAVSWAGTSPMYTGTVVCDTGLPWLTNGEIVTAAWIQYVDAGSTCVAAATINMVQESNDVRVTVIRIVAASIPVNTTMNLILEYNAALLPS